MSDETTLPISEKKVTVSLDRHGIYKPPAVVCRCKVVDNQIHFCALHDSAKRLLTTCQVVRKLLGSLKGIKQEDQTLITELVLPYVDNEISAAQG